MAETVHAGGCYCGAVRYEARGAPVCVGTCHCTDCRRSSGAPFLTSAAFPRDKVTFTSGAPALFRSSARATRGFCAACGCQLLWRSNDDDGLLDLSVGSMDVPGALPPQFHMFVRSRVKWLRLDDGLPQHETFPPD